MPVSDACWRRPAAAGIREPQTPTRSPTWRPNLSVATRGLNPKAKEFARYTPVAASSDTSRDSSYPTPSSLACSPEATSLLSSSSPTVTPLTLRPFSEQTPPSSPSSSPSSLSSSSSSSSSSSWRSDFTPSPSPTRAQCGTIRPGFIYKAQIQRAWDSKSPLLAKQPHVNAAVESHPTMVWDVYQRDGVETARCLQMTSFHNKIVEMKYSPGAWRHHCQYLPVQHGATTSVTNQPILELQGGQHLKQQSYVHLDHFFEIEVRYLVAWRAVNGPGEAGLTADSLDVLRAKLIQYITHRIWWSSSEVIPSPLDDINVGPPRNISEDVVASEARGRALELVRFYALAERDEHIWTGLERWDCSPEAKLRYLYPQPRR